MKLHNLGFETAAQTGFTHLAIVTHVDLTETAAATNQTIALATVGAGCIVDRAAMKLVTPFADASDSAQNDTKLLVGDGGDTDRYLASNTAGTGIQINLNGTEIDAFINPVAASTAGLATAPFAYTSADTVDAVFVAMSGKSLSDLDAGEVHIFLRIVDLNKLSARIS